MAWRPRRLRKVLVAGCWFVSCGVGLAGATACGHGAALSRGGQTVRALQFNLCDSGAADCFTGRSVTMAAAVIRRERPGVVTLNEVCRDDMAALAHALSATRSDGVVASTFEAAGDRPTGGPYRCRNGQLYGIGVLVLQRPAAPRPLVFKGVYPIQDPGDPEERVWVCSDLSNRFLACTTHTASTSTAVALGQCRYLLRSVLPSIDHRTGELPIILGADLNLRADGSPSPQACLAHGYQRADDGLLQDVIASGATIRSRTVIDMRGTTDHPGLLVVLTVR